MLVSNVFAENTDVISHRTIIYLQNEKVKLNSIELEKYLSGFLKVDKIPEKVQSPIFKLETSNEVQESFPPPDLKSLSYFGRGLNKQQADQFQTSKLVIVADFAYPNSFMVDGLKKSNEFSYELAKKLDGYLWDSETRELFTPKAWKENRIDAWSNDIPLMVSHTVIHAYNNDKYVRAITLGMAKFGLPDIVVNDFSWSLNREMGNLINVIAQLLVEGAQPDKDEKFEISISDLSETLFKNDMVESLKENAVSKITINIGQGKWEEGDPYNYLMEIRFDEAKGKTLHEKQEALLSSIFGWEDSISYVKHNQQIKEASRRAKEHLPVLKKAFNDGLEPGEFIQVKTPFETPDGSYEWMWVEVISWENGTIKGLLKNEPFNIPDLKGGAMVRISQADIFDYIREYPDGTSEGNETGNLIRKFEIN